MSIISTLINTWLGPKRDTKAVSLESKQTGSCGGMSTTELKIRIELVLDGVDTKQIIEPVTELAALSHALQSEFLSELTKVAELSVSHAYSLMLVYSSALNLMNPAEHAYWIERIKQALIEREFEQADSLITHYADFVNQLDKSTVQCADITDILEKLVSSISHNTLTINSMDMTRHTQAYTDGNQLFLPPSVSLLKSYAENYLLYKVMTFQLLGQLECNTRLAVDKIKAGISREGNEFLSQFSFIETVRINHYLSSEFPGLWKNIRDIHQTLGITDYPESLFSDFEQTSVFDTLALIEQDRAQLFFSEPLPYQCDFSPEALALVQSGEENSPIILMNLFNNNTDADEEALTEDKMADRISLRHNESATSPDNLPQKQSDIWEQLTETVARQQKENEKQLEKENRQCVYFYPEWDASLKQYRQNWCRVEEIPISTDIDNEDNVLDSFDLRFSEYRIKKTLDMIINSQRSIRYQSDGDDIDIDAWVEASSNKTKHADDFQNIYIRNNKNSRSVAIMFAVDISGSTAGWKNEIIQQSTWLLSRTLSKLDDQHAIYAFSGSGREHCDIYPVKKFEEKYNNTIKQRIGQLSAKQYTRMGAAIRHLSKILNQTEAKTKILFILTDGRPDDIDSYRGHYGVEDTRRAFNEAKALHLNPFVLTFDHECIDYLPHMLGKNRYRLISNISMLPVQISTIYKQLTT